MVAKAPTFSTLTCCISFPETAVFSPGREGRSGSGSFEFRVKRREILKYSLKYRTRATNECVSELFGHRLLNLVAASLGEVVKKLPKPYIP